MSSLTVSGCKQSLYLTTVACKLQPKKLVQRACTHEQHMTYEPSTVQTTVATCTLVAQKPVSCCSRSLTYPAGIVAPLVYCSKHASRNRYVRGRSLHGLHTRSSDIRHTNARLAVVAPVWDRSLIFDGMLETTGCYTFAAQGPVVWSELQSACRIPWSDQPSLEDSVKK